MPLPSVGTRVNFALWPTGSVRGSVTSRGRPVANATVEFSQISGGIWGAGSAKTDIHGNFRVDGLDVVGYDGRPGADYSVNVFVTNKLVISTKAHVVPGSPPSNVLNYRIGPNMPLTIIHPFETDFGSGSPITK